MDEIAEAHYQLTCEALHRIVKAALYGNMPARVFLLSDAGRDWLESCNIVPEAAWLRLVNDWCQRGVRAMTKST